jgi:serine/threonine-protein kinase
MLIRKKLLTKFQAMQLLNGKTQGFRLDQYTIMDGVRQDRVGMVFLADDTRAKRSVWVKVLPSDRVSDNTIWQAFTKEVRAAARVEHANVARVLDLGVFRSTHYVVSEDPGGLTLDKVLAAKGPLPANIAAQYVAQVAVVLRHAHQLGLYHRDVKPANIALTGDGRVKLLDLGLTHMLENPWARVTRRISTREYAEEIDHVAPEQAWGWEPDARSDIYSLGSTFYTLLTGQSPFPGTAAEKMSQRQLRGVPAPSQVRPGLPRDLDAILARMSAKDPHERYKSAGEVIAALHPWLPLAQWGALGAGLASEKSEQRTIPGKPIRATKSTGGTGVWATLSGLTTALWKRAK